MQDGHAPADQGPGFGIQQDLAEGTFGLDPVDMRGVESFLKPGPEPLLPVDRRFAMNAAPPPFSEQIGSIDLILVEEIGHLIRQRYPADIAVAEISGLFGMGRPEIRCTQQSEDRPADDLPVQRLLASRLQPVADLGDHIVRCAETHIGSNAQVRGKSLFQPVVHAGGLGDDPFRLKRIAVLSAHPGSEPGSQYRNIVGYVEMYGHVICCRFVRNDQYMVQRLKRCCTPEIRRTRCSVVCNRVSMPACRST